MLTFFKNFGKGILYVLVLPFLLVGLAIYGVVAIFIFLFLAVKGLILFFTGRSLYEDLPEDKEAKRRIAIQNGEVFEEKPVTDNIAPEEPQVSNDIDNDTTYVPEYLKSEILPNEKVEETSPETEEEAPIEQVEEPEEIVENTPKNTQNTTILDINEEDDDDSDDSGVTIHFE